MIKYFRQLSLFLLCLCSINISYAQTAAKRQNDSLNAAILHDLNKKTAELEAQRISDSVKKAALESQILLLKTSETIKREDIEKQLAELIDKEQKRIADKRARIDSLRLTALSYPVTGFFEDTLFLIYSSLGSFSAQERAEAITARVKKLAANFGFKADSLKIAEAETTVDLAFGETIIMSISENDALWNNTGKVALAKKYRRIIGNEVTKYRGAISWQTLVKEIGLALLVLTVLGFLIWGLIWLFGWLGKKIRLQEGKLLKGIKFRNYTLFDARKEVEFVITITGFIKWILVLLSGYIALLLLFGIFPWTKHFADILFGYILNPLKRIGFGLWNYLPNLFTIIVIIVVFHYVLKGLRFLKNEVAIGRLHINGFYPDWANPTYQIVRVMVFAFALVVIFPYLPGSDSPVFQGVSVFLGFLFTFGSSGSLSNIVAGLVLTYMRLFSLGDRVKIGEITGDVIEKSLLVTRIRTIKNEIISIPNATVMSSHTINYSSDTAANGLIVHTTVTIGYDVAWQNMHQALLSAADRTDLLLKDPKPFVLQTSLDDFYVSYQINAYTRHANQQATIYSQLHCHIQDCCNEAGIEILSPHYRAGRDGNKIAIPDTYIGKDYKAPAFNVKVEKDKE